MAHKAATQQRNSGGRRGGETPPSRAVTARSAGLERALLAVLALAAVVALVQLYIHAQVVASHGAYTSFCNVSATVNCDAVMGSAYGSLLGVPVAAWGLLSYAVLAGLVVWRRRRVGNARAQASLLVLGFALWNVGFAIFMAAVSAFALHMLCLLCLATYVLIAIAAVLAWRLAEVDVGASGSRVFTPRRGLATAAAIAIGIAAVATVQIVNRPVSGATMNAADVQARDPEFYDWYTTRPLTTNLPTAVHGKGPEHAPVTIIEFSDFECPACAMAFRDLHDLAAKNPDLVRIVFHHFPLDADCNPHVSTRMHRYACQAAIAAECAARAGKFWEYHDLLFGAQDRLDRDDLIAKAVGLGISRDTFVACLDDPSARARVLADAAAGAKLGVKSTPTLVINGRAVEGALERTRYEYVIAVEREKRRG